MKNFFEQYGGVALGILALLVLIAMITPIGNIIKTSLQGTTTKFSGSINDQVNTAMFGVQEAQNSALGVMGGSGGGSGTPESTPEPNPNPGPEAPVVPGTPTPTPTPETPVVSPVEPVTPENYDGYITEPGKYFINLLCEDKYQKPGGAIPMPYCLNYEINVFVTKKNAVTGELENSEKMINYTSYQGFDSSISLKPTNFTKELGHWTGWLDSGKPDFGKTGGDSEMVIFDITQEMLDEANGKIHLDWSSRPAMFPSVPINEFGQHIEEKVGRIESDGSQTILACRSTSGKGTWSACSN